MGQATVDLPDPLDQQPPANPGGMDDLLSQLAGDEIDRLLAEADAEAPAAPAPAPLDAPVDPIDFGETVPAAPISAPPTVPKLSPNSPLAKLNALADLPPEPAMGDVVFAAEERIALNRQVEDDPTPIDAETQASLDALTKELSADLERLPASLTVEPEAQPPTGSGLLPPGAVEQVLADEAAGLLGTKPPPSAGSVHDDAGTSAAERGALDAGVDDEIARAAAGRAALGAAPVATATATAPSPAPITTKDLDAVLGDANGEKPLPILLRPLEWLSAPLAACPPAFRDVVGKAAIITTVNAIAVLIYVMFFRG